MLAPAVASSGAVAKASTQHRTGVSSFVNRRTLATVAPVSSSSRAAKAMNMVAAEVSAADCMCLRLCG
jgi:hypothetical protein